MMFEPDRDDLPDMNYRPLLMIVILFSAVFVVMVSLAAGTHLPPDRCAPNSADFAECSEATLAAVGGN